MKVLQIRQDNRFAWYETSKEHMEDMVNKCNWQGRLLELAKDDSAHQVQPLPKWIDDQKGSDPNTDALIEYIEQLRAAHPVQQSAPVAGQIPTLLAYAAIDGDGRVDVGLTPEKAKERAGHGCDIVFGLYDLGNDVPAASVHDKQEQEYIGTHLRRVAKAAGVTVDYGNDADYYAGAFSILGDIARALDKTAASVQPSYHELLDTLQQVTTEREEARGANHKLRAELKALQPDSGRDAALVGGLEVVKVGFGFEVRRDGLPIAYGNSQLDMQLIAAAWNYAAAHPANVAQPVSDAALDQALKERDYNEAFADQLANCIADYFGVDIGEHSSANCPWTEAVRVIEEAGQVGELNLDLIERTVERLNRAQIFPLASEWSAILAAAKKGS